MRTGSGELKELVTDGDLWHTHNAAKVAVEPNRNQGEVMVKQAKAPAAAATAEKPKVLKVKAGLKFRGAREAWYARLQEFEGRPAEAYLESCEKKRPSLPKSGKPEAPAGWLRFFQRTGVASQVDVK
jgi:hypothetical protein